MEENGDGRGNESDTVDSELKGRTVEGEGQVQSIVNTADFSSTGLGRFVNTAVYE